MRANVCVCALRVALWVLVCLVKVYNDTLSMIISNYLRYDILPFLVKIIMIIIQCLYLTRASELYYHTFLFSPNYHDTIWLIGLQPAELELKL